MSDYTAGIDLGTTFAAAAVYRGGATETIELEADGPVSPSLVVPAGASESWLIGQAALDSGERLVRRFKRELGRASLTYGDADLTAEQLLTAQLRWVLDAVTRHMGAAPRATTLTHPASWGLDRRKRLENVARTAGVTDFSLLDEPLAAATFSASRTAVEPGQIVVVYDLGGGTTDVTVMSKEPDRFVALASSGIDRGSVDFDDVIIDLIEDRLSDELELDLQRMMDVAAQAKIQLSSTPQVTVPVPVGSTVVGVELTAADVRAAVTPLARSGVDHVDRSVNQAGLATSDVAVVLLAGGGSGMPLVGELIAERVQLRPTVPDWPKMSVSFGAAIAAAARAGILSERPPERPAPRPPESTTAPPPAVGGSAWPSAPPTGALTGQPAELAPSVPVLVDTRQLTGDPSLQDLQLESHYVRRQQEIIRAAPTPAKPELDDGPVQGGSTSLRDLVLVVAILALAAVVVVVALSF